MSSSVKTDRQLVEEIRILRTRLAKLQSKDHTLDVPQQVSLDGESLFCLMQGKHEGWQDEAFSEYLAHGVSRPTAMLRRGRYKLHYSLGDPPQLYDIPNDPNEFHDLSREPVYQSVVEELQAQLLSHWDPVAIEQQVRQSQVERQLIRRAYRVNVRH